MSDDTPTQRLPEPGVTPTEQLSTTPQGELVEERQRSRGLLIGLVIAGVLLLVAIIVLVSFLLGGTPSPTVTSTGSPAPLASGQPTPSTTPTSTPSETAAPPQPTGAAFTAFSPVTEVSCSRGGPDFTPEPPAIRISWQATRTASAWIVQGTSDAADSGFMQIPVSGDESGFPYPLQFPCFQDDTVFTITLVGTDGVHVSKSWTVTNVGERD
jgi:hypothetical protein